MMAKARKIENLNCEADALSNTRLVLSTRLDEMYDLRAAALDWEDIEGVHDMRVASRRLRSAIKDFAGLLGGKKSVPRRRLKEVADALGDVRDQDVAIEALEKIRAEASGEVAEGIGRLIDERAALRHSARVRLAFVVAEKPLAELREKFLSRLERVGEGEREKDGKRERVPAKATSFRQAGRKVIEARVAELQNLSHSLHHPLDSEPLHDMRIAAKRLRYAMELFAPCWGGALTPYAEEVSGLQSSLGELRDCDTWVADLGARLDRDRAESADAWTFTAGRQSEIRRAAVWLLDHFTKERAKQFRHALARWEEWETTNFFGRLESTLDETRQPANGTDSATTEEASLTEATLSKEVSVNDAGETQEVSVVQAVVSSKTTDPVAQADAPDPVIETTSARDNHVE